MFSKSEPEDVPVLRNEVPPFAQNMWLSTRRMKELFVVTRRRENGLTAEIFKKSVDKRRGEPVSF